MMKVKSVLLAGLALTLFGCVTEKVSKTSDPKNPDLAVSASTIDRDRENGTISLHVHARVQQGPRILKAEHIEIDKKAGLIFANDNCIYQNGKKIKKAQAMKFKLNEGNWIEQL